MFLEDHVDALANVHGDGHLGALMQKLELLVLFGRDVDRRAYFFARHDPARSFWREPTWLAT